MRKVSQGLLLIASISMLAFAHAEISKSINAHEPPSTSESTVTTQPVLLVDMSNNGEVSDQALCQGKDALLVIEEKQGRSSNPLSFIDQDDHRYRILTSMKELIQLTQSRGYLLQGENNFSRLRLGYMLLNKRIQTLSLSDAGITALYISQISEKTTTAFLKAKDKKYFIIPIMIPQIQASSPLPPN